MNESVADSIYNERVEEGVVDGNKMMLKAKEPSNVAPSIKPGCSHLHDSSDVLADGDSDGDFVLNPKRLKWALRCSASVQTSNIHSLKPAYYLYIDYKKTKIFIKDSLKDPIYS